MIEEVLIEAEAPLGHAEAVEGILKRRGLQVSVEPAIERRSGEALPWLIRIAVEGTIYELLKYIAKAGTAEIKNLVHDLWEAREGTGNGHGTVELVDSESTHVILPSTLRDEALDALADLDLNWSELRGGYLVWREDRQVWEDHFQRR